jgi:hypothetical protein
LPKTRWVPLVIAAMAAQLVVMSPAQAAPIPGSSCQVFPADNVWNRDISSLPVHARSSTWVARVAGQRLDYDFGRRPYGMPYTLVDPLTPRVPITFASRGGYDADLGPYPFGPTTPVQGQADRHAIMIDRQSCVLYELYDAWWNGGLPYAGFGAIFDLRSNALRPDNKGSANDAGLPIFPGLVRLDEVRSGEIRHALIFSLQQVDSSRHLWPARFTPSYLGTPDESLPPMGARFRLKASYDISGYSRDAQVILTALKRYGMFAYDIGADWTLAGTEDSGWQQWLADELPRLPSSQLEAVDESSLMVDPNSGATVTSLPGTPSSVTATAGNALATVSWTAPSAGEISGYTVTPRTGSTDLAPVTVSGSPAPISTLVTGLSNGTAYTFTVRATNVAGTGPPSGASNSVTPSAGAYTGFFNWYDLASPGMYQDNIHVVNPGPGAAEVTVTIPTAAPISFSVGPGQEVYRGFPPGTIGGPVAVIASARVLASQRVTYLESFNEVAALTASAASLKSYFNWYDKASPGMFQDNIHVINPGGSAALVSLSLPGVAGVSPVSFTVAAGQEAYGGFPAGTIGGPLLVTASAPVIASQRVTYQSSFNEVAASSGPGSTRAWFNWYDKASGGMFQDNIHVVNPGPAAALVVLSLPTQPGTLPVGLAVGAGQEAYAGFPGGTQGGPVLVTSSVPVIASQRVTYLNSFNEVPAAVGAGLTQAWFNWYDKASPGMLQDNVHVVNPGGAPAGVTVTVQGYSPISFVVAPGAEVYQGFPAGTIGGPVRVSSNVPVIASQRVTYLSSFNEVLAQG